MHKVYLLLPYLACVVFCQWSKPLLVQAGGSKHETGIYLRPSGEVLAFFSWSDSVCYKAIKDEKIVQENCFCKGKLAQDLSVVPINNGTGIFVAFSAPRVSQEKGCGKESRDGCMDIYYTESLDAGATWTHPRQAPRKDLNDPVHRTSPQALHISETGRTFIFYLVPGEDINRINSVTKSKGSSVFSPESAVYSNRYAFSKLKAQYINQWDTITIYVGYECLYWFSIVYTSDNGISWSKPKAKQFVTKRLQYVMTRPVTADNLFLAVMDLGLLTLSVVDDEGVTTSSSFYHLGEFLGHKPLVTAYPEDGVRYLVSAQRKGRSQSTHIYNVGQKLLTDIRVAAPFSCSDKAVLTKGQRFLVSVLHNVTADLYISTLSLPRE